MTGDHFRDRQAREIWWASLKRAIGAVVARFVHTEEVTGSNPVSPTQVSTSFARGTGSTQPSFARGTGSTQPQCLTTPIRTA